MRVCTFNLNSIRARKDLITAWLNYRNNDIDVLCFQETKVTDKDFPHDTLERLGYSCEVYGQKSYNGVAICSRLNFESVMKGFNDIYYDDQKRIICAKINGINLINVYAPHGDLRGTEKYNYKLKWYDKFLSLLKENYSSQEKLMIMGDFNVAREDLDVFNTEATRDSIGTMDEEREALQQILDWGLKDTFRQVYPRRQQFTWWDYIGGAIWKNEGMRIDYVLCTKPLSEKILHVEVDTWPRTRRTPKPSDHAPVIIELDIDQ
jgi:exodeoxyribonuclease-3